MQFFFSFIIKKGLGQVLARWRNGDGEKKVGAARLGAWMATAERADGRSFFLLLFYLLRIKSQTIATTEDVPSTLLFQVTWTKNHRKNREKKFALMMWATTTKKIKAKPALNVSRMTKSKIKKKNCVTSPMDFFW